MLTSAEKSLLLAEITNDPLALGYAALVSAGDRGALLNALNATDPGAGSVDVQSITSQALQSSVVASEFSALTTQARELWQAVLIACSGGVSVNDAGIKAQILAVWGAGTQTRANIASKQTRAASRAETVIGREIAITLDDLRGLQ